VFSRLHLRLASALDKINLHAKLGRTLYLSEKHMARISESTKFVLVCQVVLSVLLFVYGWTSSTILSVCLWSLMIYSQKKFFKTKSSEIRDLFKDKNVWITGASSGIGEALVGLTLMCSARRKLSPVDAFFGSCLTGQGVVLGWCESDSQRQTTGRTGKSSVCVSRTRKHCSTEGPKRPLDTHCGFEVLYFHILLK
jgi:hypothetical protein